MSKSSLGWQCVFLCPTRVSYARQVSLLKGRGHCRSAWVATPDTYVPGMGDAPFIPCSFPPINSLCADQQAASSLSHLSKSDRSIFTCTSQRVRCHRSKNDEDRGPRVQLPYSSMAPTKGVTLTAFTVKAVLPVLPSVLSVRPTCPTCPASLNVASFVGAARQPIHPDRGVAVATVSLDTNLAAARGGPKVEAIGGPSATLVNRALRATPVAGA